MSENLLGYRTWRREYSNHTCINDGQCYLNNKCHSVKRWFMCQHYQCYLNKIDRPCCVVCGNSNRRKNMPCRICYETVEQGIVGNFCFSCEENIIFEVRQSMLNELLEINPTT